MYFYRISEGQYEEHQYDVLSHPKVFADDELWAVVLKATAAVKATELYANFGQVCEYLVNHEGFANLDITAKAEACHRWEHELPCGDTEDEGSTTE